MKNSQEITVLLENIVGNLQTQRERHHVQSLTHTNELTRGFDRKALLALAPPTWDSHMPPSSVASANQSLDREKNNTRACFPLVGYNCGDQWPLPSQRHARYDHGSARKAMQEDRNNAHGSSITTFKISAHDFTAP